MVNIFFCLFTSEKYLYWRAGGRGGSGSCGGYLRAKALLLMPVYVRGKEKIQITQRQSLGDAEKNCRFLFFQQT